MIRAPFAPFTGFDPIDGFDPHVSLSRCNPLAEQFERQRKSAAERGGDTFHTPSSDIGGQ